MKRQELLAGIAAYKPEQDWLLEQMAQHGGKLTADEFDALFGPGKGPPPRLTVFSPETFILGGMSGTEWAEMLDLLQTMARAGLVSIHDEAGVVTYRPEKSLDAWH